MKKQKNENSKLGLLKYGFKAVWAYDKKAFFLLAVQEIAVILFPLMPAVFSADIVNGIIAEKSARYLIIEGIIAAAVTALLYFTQKGLTYYVNMLNDKLVHLEQKMYAEKMMRADFTLLEDAHFKEISRAWYTSIQNGGGSLYIFAMMINRTVGGITGLFVSLGFLFPTLKACFTIDNESFLTSWKMLALLGGAIAVIVALLLLLSSSQTKKTLRLERLSDFLYAQYVYWVDYIADYKNGKEIRLYKAENAVGYEFNTFNDKIRKMDGERIKVIKKFQPIMFSLQGLITGVLYLFIALKAYAGVFAPGNIILFIGAMDSIVNAVNLIGSLPMAIGECTLRVATMKEVLDSDKSKYKGSIPVEKRSDNQYEIEFKNVTFAYPGTDKPVLKNFSIKLKIGERLAIVGKNGSGKTTFIKLLCRFYDPQKGQILLNGIDIKKYNPDEYASIFSVVFQDFKIFSAPLDKNVTTSLDYDSKRLWDSLEKAGVADRVRRMQDKEKTVLYKEFDKNGVDISGGEAQKLALARALYKDAPFIILDEPTAALDPIAEADIYQRFNSFVGEKTAVYISHRLSSCRFCDKIAVFDGGELVQTGSHEKLLSEHGGVYEKLWNAQAQYYV